MKYPNIKVPPPGPIAREILKRDEEVISQSFTRYYPLVVKSGKGSIVEDVDGNQYIDFNSGILCSNVGHSHPYVIERIKKQIEKFLNYSLTDFYFENAVTLAEELCKITPGSFKKRVYFGNSGTEAIEAAIKMARWHTRKPYFIAFINSFHGRTIGALSLTASKPVQRKYFSPLMPNVVHVPFSYCYRCAFKQQYPECNLWCVDYIKEYVLEKYVPPEEVAAIVFEPIQGEGGYIFPPDDYFIKLKKLADEYDILLIDDEIQAGMGRTGKWFAIEHYNISPDIICIAKSLASGLPLGATVAEESIMDWEVGSHATTFGGNPVSCEAALATISVVKNENLLERATKLGRNVLKRLKEMEEKYELIGDVRGKGLMIGVEIVVDKKTKKPGRKEVKEIMMRCFKQGLAIISCGISTFRIAPPLNIEEEYLEIGLNIFEDVIKEYENELKIRNKIT